MKTTHSTPEILEDRIAPANFLVSPVALIVTDAATGADAMDTTAETDSRITVASDIAVSLEPGDRLVFDKNFNGKLDKTDPVMVTVAAGHGMVLMNDLDHDGGLDFSEITGVATSGAFAGAINTDVHGSVLTVLDSLGAVASSAVGAKGVVVFPLNDGSITKLDVKGAITGALVAGGGISHVTIGTPIAGSSDLSVGSITTGKSVPLVPMGGISQNASAGSQSGSTATGGTIEDVTLAAGTRSITTSHTFLGSDSFDISRVKILEQSGDLTITAGQASTGTGGSIRDVTVLAKNAVPGSLSFIAGLGAFGFGTAPAGNGGSIEGLTINAVEIAGAISLLSGAGGDANGTSNSANGGAISRLNITVTKTLAGGVTVYGGAGGAGGTTGQGGAGGRIDPLTLTAGEITGFCEFRAGTGGAGTVGGAGGDVAGFSLKTKLLDSGIELAGGSGGESTGAAGARGGNVSSARFAVGSHHGGLYLNGGNGGNGSTAGGEGGAVQDVTYAALKSSDGGWFANGGTGGSSSNGAGSAGGALSRISLSAPVLGGGINIQAGGGGTGGTVGSNSAPGGAGGAIDTLKITIGSSLIDAKGYNYISSGQGGSAQNQGTGGDGGQMSDVTYQVGTANPPLTLATGGGGNGAAGGDGGAMLRTKVIVTGKAPVGIELRSGAGGNGTTTSGGNGGTLTDCSITSASVGSTLYISGGQGGSGESAGGAGGSIVNGFIGGHGSAILQAGFGGAGLSSGGTGGSVTRSTIKIGTGSASIFGSDGGTSASSPGNGGSVDQVTASVARQLGSASQIFAGAGGSGPAAGAAGSGGDVTKSSLSVLSGIGTIEIKAGNATASSTGTSGHGGKIEDMKVTLGANFYATSFTIEAGDGSSAGGSNAGGDGGVINKLAVTSSATLGAVFISTGNGGGATNGPAGAGGNLVGSSFTSLGPVTSSLHFELGEGGNTGGASGGAGGSITQFSATFGKGIVPGTPVLFEAGNGGAANIPTFAGAGGAGGNIDGFTLNDKAGASFQLRGGIGGNSGQDGPDTGGAGGDLLHITLNARAADVTLGGDASGQGGLATLGGAGGDVSNVSGTVGKLVVIAGDGGGTSGPSTGAHGGDGGNVTIVNVKATTFVQQLRAGSGGTTGNGLGNIGGFGGRLQDSTIVGDIGNFFVPFGVGISQMGGIIAGLGGTGDAGGSSSAGSVERITAGRIAAIFAGASSTSSDLSSANTAFAVAKITAKTIGADLDKDGALDFTDAGAVGFNLADADLLIDGLVLARTAGFETATVKTVAAPFLVLA